MISGLCGRVRWAENNSGSGTLILSNGSFDLVIQKNCLVSIVMDQHLGKVW